MPSWSDYLSPEGIAAIAAILSLIFVGFQMLAANRIAETQLVITFMEKIPRLIAEADKFNRAGDFASRDSVARLLLGEIDLLLGLHDKGRIGAFARDIILNDLHDQLLPILQMQPFNAIFSNAKERSYRYIHEWLTLHDHKVERLPRDTI